MSARTLKLCIAGGITSIGTATYVLHFCFIKSLSSVGRVQLKTTTTTSNSSYWQEQQKLKYDAPRGRRMVRELEARLAALKIENRKKLQDVMEFCECADEMKEIQVNLWKERIRRWLATEEFEDKERVMPIIFHNWKRLEKLYTDLRERATNQFDNGNFGDLVDVCLKLHDLKGCGTTDAATAEVKVRMMPSTVSICSRVTRDPLLVSLLESSEVDVMLTQHIDSCIFSLEESLKECTAPQEIDALNFVSSLNYEKASDAETAYDNVKSFLPDLICDSDENIKSEALKLEKLLRQYAINVQATNVFEAYLATILMGAISASPTTRWKK